MNNSYFVLELVSLNSIAGSVGLESIVQPQLGEKKPSAAYDKNQAEIQRSTTVKTINDDENHGERTVKRQRKMIGETTVNNGENYGKIEAKRSQQRRKATNEVRLKQGKED